MPLEGESGRPNEVSVVKYEIGTGPWDHESIIGSGYDENSLYTFKEKNTLQPSPNYSKELFQLVDDNEQTNPFVKVIKKAMRYMEQKDSNDGCWFTKEDLYMHR